MVNVIDEHLFDDIDAENDSPADHRGAKMRPAFAWARTALHG